LFPSNLPPVIDGHKSTLATANVAEWVKPPEEEAFPLQISQSPGITETSAVMLAAVALVSSTNVTLVPFLILDIVTDPVLSRVIEALMVPIWIIP
jgi:hypothetical protein